MYTSHSTEIDVSHLVLNPIAGIHQTFEVSQNRPNPFTQQSEIDLTVFSPGEIEFSIINPTGKVLLVDKKYYTTGTHSISINSGILDSPGLYFYKVSSDKKSLVKKMCFY